MFNWLEIGQIIFADLILSGDNALVIGMAAAGLAANQRKKVILYWHGVSRFIQDFVCGGRQHHYWCTRYLTSGWPFASLGVLAFL
ncbi:MAG: hypothetical protein ACI9EP_001227 [Oceanospirillaceae bacterium]